MHYNEIQKKLKSLSDPKAVEGMARFGINPTNTYGVSIPNLRKIAKEVRVNHDLAQQLWTSNIRETMILATMIDDPGKVTVEQMEDWVKDFSYWEICDQCCNNLFRKTRFAHQKTVEWSSREEEFVKRAAFTLTANLAVHDNKAPDEVFIKILPLIKREASDNRTFVKKAVNWALRQIGKRNLNLNRKAIEVAEEIRKTDSQSARWVASDAIRELTSREVQERLGSR